MAKDFKTLKQQLRELSSIINSFKSEAVQLKIVQGLFGQQGLPVSMEPLPSAAAKPKSKNGRRKRRKLAAAPPAVKRGRRARKKARGPRRLGVVRMLQALIEDGFFKKARGIGEAVAAANAKFKGSFKQVDFSGPLLKLTRDKRLSRAQNKEGKFEYTAK